jgi:tetratricopeptide (TPR) repeat protein
MKIIGKKSSNQYKENFNRGYNYLKSNRLDKAIIYLKKAGESRETLLNLGAAYMHMGDYNNARKVLTLSRNAPSMTGEKSADYVSAILNLGLIEYHNENDDLAIEYYREGLEKCFDFDLVYNYANARLRQYCSGKYDDLKYCWQLYESRFQIINAVSLTNRANWTGGHVESITVLSEQGIGDCIMFARYLPYLREYCDRLVVQCEESLNCVFSRYEISNSKSIDTTHAVAFGSLGNLLDHIPSGEFIGGGNSGSMIGCVWRSNNTHSNNILRNCDEKYFLSLGNVGSLGPDCIGGMPRLPSSSWTETMATLRELKCVVTIDTAIAHLCGAMGVKCYVIMPLHNSDFRWGDSSMGYNNKWYKSVTVIRNPGSWDAAFKDLKQCLKLADQT